MLTNQPCPTVLLLLVRHSQGLRSLASYHIIVCLYLIFYNAVVMYQVLLPTSKKRHRPRDADSAPLAVLYTDIVIFLLAEVLLTIWAVGRGIKAMEEDEKKGGCRRSGPSRDVFVAIANPERERSPIIITSQYRGYANKHIRAMSMQRTSHVLLCCWF
ncbi:hypothetical protein V8C26DRAFT_25001 [Trichoderma gracile]